MWTALRDRVLRATPEARWTALTRGLLAVLCLIVLATFLSYGTTWDEDFHREYGDLVIAWFSSGFRDQRALGFLNLYLYGGLFDAIAQLAARALPFGVFESRHLVNAGFAVLGVYAATRLAALLGGARAGFLAATFLALTPVYYGHGFNNPKDIPFAALAALALLYVVRAAREVPAIPLRLVVKTGLALGAALAVRAGGAFLVTYPIVLWSAVLGVRLRGEPRETWPRLAGRVALQGVAMLAIAYAMMVAFWPWAQQAPLTRPIEGIRAATRFPWDSTVFFDGRFVRSTELPWSYLPTWFAVSLPEAYLVAAAAGGGALAAILLRRRQPLDAWRSLSTAVVALAVVFPVAAAIAIRAVLYDAQRHFLFVLPPLAVLAGLGVARALEIAGPVLRAALAGALLFSAGLTLVDMVELHPYQSVYFNRLVAGGLQRASARFETDYWGASYREGVEWLVANYRPAAPRRITVANCSDPHQTGYWLERIPGGERFVNVRPEDEPDVFLATTRFDCHKVVGRVLHVVERQGTPLLYVIERRWWG
jgi:hypothetical protein